MALMRFSMKCEQTKTHIIWPDGKVRMVWKSKKKEEKKLACVSIDDRTFTLQKLPLAFHIHSPASKWKRRRKKTTHRHD